MILFLTLRIGRWFGLLLSLALGGRLPQSHRSLSLIHLHFEGVYPLGIMLEKILGLQKLRKGGQQQTVQKSIRETCAFRASQSV